MIVYGGNHHYVKPSEQPLYEPDEPERKRGSYEAKRNEARARMLGEMERNPAHSKHGTLYGYQCGCRCPRCVDARADYVEKRKAHL